MFEFGDHLDGLHAWPTERLVVRREELVREQRRLRIEELAVVRVLDERGQIDVAMAGRDGVSERSLRETVETARALESLPAVAAAAYAGDLSAEQLGSVVALADEDSDAEWARRAPNVAPVDLARLARTKTKPTFEEGRARYEARGLRMWWRKDKGMLHVRGELPDVMGAKFEATIQHLTEQMKPAKGHPWAPFEHRAADALVGMCDAVKVAEQVENPTLAAQPLFVVQCTKDGPAEVAGIALPDSIVEALLASASIEPVLVDDDGVPVAIGKRTTFLSPKVVRAVLLRDGHCRIPGCEICYSLQAHHLRPKSWGGDDELSDLAAVCTAAGHHQMLVPNGPWALVGNPNLPDGLRLVHIDHLTDEDAEQLGLPPPRAGPTEA